MSTEIVRRSASLTEQKEYARALATAGTLPKQYRERPGDILLAMAYADSLNLPVAQVFVGLHVIEGKPSMSSELMVALIQRAGHLTRISQSPPGGPWAEAWAAFTITRITGDTEPYTETFSMRDAVQAKLLTITDGVIRSRTQRGEPTPWENYPRAMLKARAISAAARAHCADVLAGVSYTPEEIRPPAEMAYIDADPEPPAQPAPVVEADPDVPAEGDHTGEADRGPENRSQGVEMSDPGTEQPDGPPDDPGPTVVEADPPAEADWRIDWRRRLDQASIYDDGLRVAIDLGNEAAANGDPVLVEQARSRYRVLAQQMDDIARDGS